MPSLAASRSAFSGHSGIGTLPIVYFGTEEQKKKYLPKLATGELDRRVCALGIVIGIRRAELPDQGRALARRQALRPERRKDVDHECIGFADVFIIFAKIDGEKFTAFIVERGYPGSPVGAEEHKMGIRGSSTCPLILNDCQVPVENLLGEIGKGHIIAFNILNIGRFKLGAACVGGARNSLQQRDRYAKQRKAFGKTIADFGIDPREAGRNGGRDLRGRGGHYRTVGMIDAALAEVDKARGRRSQRDAQGASRSTRSSARSSRCGARRCWTTWSMRPCRSTAATASSKSIRRSVPTAIRA